MPAYDYIIVGAGSSGCVVANRLSADPSVRVLVLEAGGRDWHPLLAMPFACGQVFYDRRFNWPLETLPEPFADGRVLQRAAGKVLGGGSSINGLVYTRGDRRDYDAWAQAGASGWSYDDVRPYFERAEGRTAGAGSVALSRQAPDSAYDQIGIAARALGLHVPGDFDDAAAEGFGLPQLTIRKGWRASTASSYLGPTRGRANLRVELRAQATRVLFEGLQAVGIEYVRNGRLRRATATREVIVCAGAYHSPKLLLLSGVGPADELTDIGVRPLHDLPGVGQNLQEHPGVPMTWRGAGPSRLDAQLRLDRLILSVCQWGLTGGGAVANLPLTAMAFCRSQPQIERPDVEWLFGPALVGARIWFPGWRRAGGSSMSVSAFLMRPASRGSVKLRSANPHDPPVIRLNLLAEESDRTALVASMRQIRDLMACAPAASLVAEETGPGLQAESDAALLAHIRRTVRTMQHPVGSCRMGVGPDAVVDRELRVLGLEGLRVIDASIMPTIVTGHTNAAAIMIGEKGADLVLGSRTGAAARTENSGQRLEGLTHA